MRLTRGEMLLFKGEALVSGPKGEEFPVLAPDLARGVVYVPFVKDDGTMIAVTLPADAVEVLPRDGWIDLQQGLEMFREGRYEDARRLLVRASQDATYKAVAAPLAARVNAALLTQGAPTLQTLRDLSEPLLALGYQSLALALEEGTDKLGGAGAPASKVNRENLAKQAAISNRAVARARQALAWKRTTEAAREIEAGLKAEPARPELKAWQPRALKDVAEADSRYEAADSMRRFPKGTVHALTAIEHGLKVCADHPRLIALRKEMEGAFEARTSPKIDAAFLSAAGVSATPALHEGRALYTNRCTECHELELLDSRSVSGWQKAVAGMSGRAHLNAAQQATILDYIAAAQKVVEKLPPE